MGEAEMEPKGANRKLVGQTLEPPLLLREFIRGKLGRKSAKLLCLSFCFSFLSRLPPCLSTLVSVNWSGS